MCEGKNKRTLLRCRGVHRILGVLFGSQLQLSGPVAYRLSSFITEMCDPRVYITDVTEDSAQGPIWRGADIRKFPVIFLLYPNIYPDDETDTGAEGINCRGSRKTPETSSTGGRYRMDTHERGGYLMNGHI